jgi:DNA-directed RNA polymerase subunit RPC12/RpoP
MRSAHIAKSATIVVRFPALRRDPSKTKTMPSSVKQTRPREKPRCGLCGKTKNLTKTDCCGNWICDDSHKYVLFSYARNSCYRNHDHYTLCSYHHREGHKGSWKNCRLCRKSFKTEIFVWYGTNEYNFEKLENPPEFERTFCAGCGRVISLVDDAYMAADYRYWCETCAQKRLAKENPRQKK